MHDRGLEQCRINNNATDPAALRVKCILYYMQGWILEFGQYLRKEALFNTCYTKTLFGESKLNFSFCLGICLCVKLNFTL